MKSVSVVVPLFDEAPVVEELRRRLASVLDGTGLSSEMVFVDDGSGDGTADILARLAREDGRVTVVELARNYGQTAALAAGIDAARGEVIVTMDGDLQHAPEDIPRFLAELDKGYDLVSGRRVGRSDNLFVRRIPSLCANAAARWSSGAGLRDFGSTYKAYRADLVKQLDLFGDLHRFIPVLAHRLGARTVEIPIHVGERRAGASHYGLGRTFGVFQDLVFLEFYLKYLTRPLRVFGALFFAAFGTGFLLSVVLMTLWAAGVVRAVLEHEALLLFSVFLMIVGVQFLVAGILAELLTRIYLKSSGGKIYSVRRTLRDGRVRPPPGRARAAGAEP